LFPKKNLAIPIYRPDQAQFTRPKINLKPTEPDPTCESLCHGRHDIAPTCTPRSFRSGHLESITS
jgi:hypothetical protein